MTNIRYGQSTTALNDDVGANHITSKGKLDVKGLQSCFTVAIAASAVSRTLGIYSILACPGLLVLRYLGTWSAYAWLPSP